MKRLVLFFQNKWNKQNLRDVQNTVKLYLQLSEEHAYEKYLDSEEDLLTKLQEHEKEIDDELVKITTEMSEKEVDPENQGIEYVRMINSKEGHKQTEYMDYYLQEYKTKLYLSQLFEKEEIVRKFIDLKFSKFQRIFQLAFYLLRKEKQEINLPDSNVFNWRKFKESTHSQLFKELLEYQYQGLKVGEFKKYNKVDNIMKALEGLDAEQIKKFSYPFYMVHRALVNLCQLRMMDIKKRREEVKIFNKIIEIKNEQKTKREELMKQEMDLAKQEFYNNLVENEPQEKSEEND